MMSKSECCIFLIDDDEAIRHGISLLLTSAGYKVECFSDAENFLETGKIEIAGCILLDIFLEGKSGLELQEQIKSKFDHLPIIYITGHGDVPMSVKALKNGAINFLQKPIDDIQLFDALDEAVNISAQILSEKTELHRIQLLINSLTQRETEILRFLIRGLLNKQIATELGIVEQTVKVHRGRITAKLGLKSVAEMVRLAEKIKFH
jgi:two-component system, LuxR family, response regulator FixJ